MGDFYAPPVDPGYGKIGEAINKALQLATENRLRETEYRDQQNQRKRANSVNGVFEQLPPLNSESTSHFDLQQQPEKPDVFSGQAFSPAPQAPDYLRDGIVQPNLMSSPPASPYAGGVGMAHGDTGALIHQAFAPFRQNLRETQTTQTEPVRSLEGGGFYLPDRDIRRQQEDRRYAEQEKLYGERNNDYNDRQQNAFNQQDKRAGDALRAREADKKQSDFKKLRENKASKVGYGERRSISIANALDDARSQGIDWNSDDPSNVETIAKGVYSLEPKLADQGITARDLQRAMGTNRTSAHKHEVNTNDLFEKAWAKSTLQARPGGNQNDRYRSASRDSTGTGFSPAKAFNDFKNNRLPEIPEEHRAAAIKMAEQRRDSLIEEKKKMDKDLKPDEGPSLFDRVTNVFKHNEPRSETLTGKKQKNPG